MSDNPQSGHTETPLYNLEGRKEYRANSVSPDQWKWIGFWFVVSAILLILPWILEIWVIGGFSFVRALCIITGPLMVFGFYKNEDGLGFRNVQAKLENRNMRKNRDDKGSIQRAKRPPIGLRVVGFPTGATAPEFPEELLEDLDQSELDRIMEQFNEDNFTLGTVYSREDNSDTAFVVGTGIKSANADSTGSFMGRAKVVSALKQIAIESDDLPSFSLIYSTRPLDLMPIVTWNAENLNPEVTKAQSLALSNQGIKDGIPVLDEETFFGGSIAERHAASINLMTAKAAVDGQEGSMAIGITVSRPAHWKHRKDGTIDRMLTPKQLQEAPITNLTLLLEQELERAGVSDVAALSESDINRFVRSKWDIKGIREWYTEVADHAASEAVRLFAPEGLPEEVQEHSPPPSPWPKYKIVPGKNKKSGKSFLFIDGTYHRVLQVKKFGNTKVFADDFLPLFASQDIQPASMTGLTVSVCGDTVNVENEQKMLTRRIVFQRAFNSKKEGIRYETPADLEKKGMLENKQLMLHTGGAFALSYNVFITISAVTPELLDGVERRVKAHARECRIKLRYISDESRQLRAFATANFGVSMSSR
jgi:hypothetical protein